MFPFPLPGFSKERRRHYASYGFIFLRQNHALEVGGPIWQAFLKDPLNSEPAQGMMVSYNSKVFSEYVRPKFVSSHTMARHSLSVVE
ncbi:hypothetical protein TNCV_4412761 [Trichonephila clavipes]|nr:hypothetical protein TNCV_4412761 [Trichonephila clavipes]